jgi:NAD(P)H-hydrate epimerase
MLILTAEAMRRLDQLTIERYGIPGEELMARAGAGVVEALERAYGPMLGLNVIVLCGPGNNGGDGFVTAAVLRARGAQVHVGLAGDPARVKGDALTHLEHLTHDGFPVASLRSSKDLERFVASRPAWDYAIDALLGTGARGEPEGLIGEAVQALRELDERGTRVVAVDLPTGVNADTGAIARRAVRADLTVTFGFPKRGHLLYPGRAFVGTLEVIDIGLAPQAIPSLGVKDELATPHEMAQLIPARNPRAHKGEAGKVLVIGGSVGMTGALALAARAVMRVGAGWAMAAVPASLNDVLEVKLTEELTVPMPETAERSLAVAAIEPLLARAAEVNAVALGPGLSRHADSLELARRLLPRLECPAVVDADGLVAFVGRTDLFAAHGGPLVLTPHLGELSRLTGVSAADLEARRIDAAREWAQRWRVVLLVKGAPTAVASPDGRVTVNPTGNPGMASAGMGDVLTGAIAGLMAQGVPAYEAACLGAYVHGLAGDVAAGVKGQHGLLAGDVLESLPDALVGLWRVRGGKGEAQAESAASDRERKERTPASS